VFDHAFETLSLRIIAIDLSYIIDIPCRSIIYF